MSLLQFPVWKKIFWILSIALLIVMPAISHDYGQNGDEDVEAQYGRDIYNFYAKGDTQALDYDTHKNPVFGTNISGMQFYGGLFDVAAESIHQLLPSSNIMIVRHFLASVFGAFLMIFTGLLAFELSRKKWWVAVLALLFMIFSPRIFGESMNNGKDIPFATGMVIGIYYFVRLLHEINERKEKWKNTIGLIIGILIVFGMRPAGGLLLAAYFGLFTLVYLLTDEEAKELLLKNKFKLIKAFVLQLIIAFVVGYGLSLITWPYGLVAPVGHLFTSLAEMSNRSIIIQTLYDGINYPSNQTPWQYNFKWIIITTPIVIVVCFFIFFPLIGKACKRYGFSPVFLLLFSALFPLLYIIYKHSTNFDSWRHVFFVYPYWVILSVLSVEMLGSFLKGKLKWVPLAMAFLGLTPAIGWTITSHPYQYVFFNQFVGGIKGASGNYELDYYQISNREMVNWILKNVPKPADGSKLVVKSNMDGMNTYFRNDTSWVKEGYARYYERNQKYWDYYITYSRFISPWQLQHGKWPPAHVVYAVKVDGVPIGVILKRSSEASYYAYEALKKNDFNTAINAYQVYLKTDSSDEMVYLNYGIALASVGRIDEGISALNKAVLLNPTMPEFYQILAQMYKAKGDIKNAQNSLMRAQSIEAQEYLESN